jgi:hypothetical protein
VNYVRGFAPWLCYALLSAFDWRLGLSAAAVASLLLLVAQLRTRSVDLLGAATTGFFIVMAVIAIADPTSGLGRWITVLANGTLAVTALASLAVRRPFTLSISRKQVPRELWHAPRFIHVNVVLTSIWAAAFVGGAVAAALIIGFDDAATAPLIAVQVLAFVIPFVASGRYAARAQAQASRILAEHAAVEPQR